MSGAVAVAVQILQRTGGMSPDLSDMATTVRRLLEEGRLHDVLRLMNERVEHRFTGVYRFDPPTLRNVALFDAANPDIEVGADTPLMETYCSIAGESGEPFQTGNASGDQRLTEHPARESTVAYCGAPLKIGEAEPFGTLCHFDVVPRSIPSAELPVLEAVAPVIAEHLREQGSEIGASGERAPPG